MKKNTLFVLSLLSVLLGNTLYSQEFIIDDIEYVINSHNTVFVSEMNTTASGDVVIPETITYEGADYTVTGIRNASFSNNNLTSIVIPDTVFSIDENAFFGNMLTSVDLPAALERVILFSFAGNNISKLTIPNGVKEIEQDAFYGNQISSITLPASLILFYPDAFSDNPLREIICDSEVPIPITTGNLEMRAQICVTVPAGTRDAYIAEGWTGFQSIKEDSTLGVANAEEALFDSLEKDVELQITEGSVRVSSSKAKLKYFHVYDLTGADVLKGSDTLISTENLAHGVYILTLEFDEGLFQTKLIR